MRLLRSSRPLPARCDGSPEKLHVIAVVSNAMRFDSRYRLFKQFEAQMLANPMVELYVVETAFGDRPYECAVAGNPRHLRLKAWDEVWNKETSINLGFQIMDPSWQYVAWIDADVTFLNPQWVEETIHQLQHYMVVQPWSDAIDFGPEGEMIQTHKSFCSQYRGGYPRNKPGYSFWHPGYAWAARREAIEAVGGLIDTASLGAGDHHMALSLIGESRDSFPGGISEGYKRPIMRWQELALRYLKKDIGFCQGTIQHHWHGKKKDRKYVERWQVLVQNKFDPFTDLKRDWQGLWQLEVNDERQMKLRDQFRDYMQCRNEDSTDVV